MRSAYALTILLLSCILALLLNATFPIAEAKEVSPINIKANLPSVDNTFSDGLVLHLPLQGNAVDQSRFANHGVVQGAMPTTDRFGSPNSAYKFDGIDDHIIIPDNASLDIVDEVTLSAWVFVEDFDGDPGIISKVQTNSRSPWELEVLDDVTSISPIAFRFMGAHSYRVNSFTAMSDDSDHFELEQWYFVAGVAKDGVATLYVNGTKIVTDTYSGNFWNNNQDVFIGTRWSHQVDFHFFKGSIDDVRIYNRALSEAEIQALYVIPFTTVISGPTSGIVNTPYTFTATTIPVTTTQPITYSWYASEQPTVVNTGALNDSVSFVWNISGTQVVTVTAQNVVDIVTSTYTININQVSSNLILHLPFDGDALDQSGYDNHGVVNGAALTTDRLGRANSAYKFDGIDDHIVITDNVTLDIVDEVTLSAWVFVEAFDGDPGIISKVQTNSRSPWELEVLDDEVSVSPIAFRFMGAYNYRDNSFTAMSDDTDHFELNQWYFVAGIAKDGVATLYVNGIPVASDTYSGTFWNNNYDVFIGARWSHQVDFHFFKGSIDEVRIYNRALTLTELRSLYSQTFLPTVERSNLAQP